MTASRILTHEEIQAGLREAKAAVEHARQVIERSRARRAELGVTPERVRQFISEMSPHAQLWVNTLVSIGRKKLEPAAPTPAAKPTPRKPRMMV